MAPAYVPDAGDIVWLQFDPQARHEQAGHRPAVVLSPASYNGRAGMILCCRRRRRSRAIRSRWCLRDLRRAAWCWRIK